MAADPIHGCILTPRGENTPAATGIPIYNSMVENFMIAKNETHKIVDAGEHEVEPNSVNSLS